MILYHGRRHAVISKHSFHLFAVRGLASHTDAALTDRKQYWKHIPRWQDITEKEFLNYKWQVSLLFSETPNNQVWQRAHLSPDFKLGSWPSTNLLVFVLCATPSDSSSFCFTH